MQLYLFFIYLRLEVISGLWNVLGCVGGRWIQIAVCPVCILSTGGHWATRVQEVDVDVVCSSGPQPVYSHCHLLWVRKLSTHTCGALRRTVDRLSWKSVQGRVTVPVCIHTT